MPRTMDESKVTPPQNLPDPLKLNDGKPVTSAKMWWDQRRPEIVESFDREILGRLPKNTPAVTWQVTSTATEKNGDVPVITKNLLGHVGYSSYLPINVDIQLTLTTPSNATGPVPVIMELSWSAEAMAAIRKRFTPQRNWRPSPTKVPPGSSNFSPKAGATLPSSPPAFSRTTAPASPKASSASSTKANPAAR